MLVITQFVTYKMGTDHINRTHVAEALAEAQVLLTNVDGREASSPALRSLERSRGVEWVIENETELLVSIRI